MSATLLLRIMPQPFLELFLQFSRIQMTCNKYLRIKHFLARFPDFLQSFNWKSERWATIFAAFSYHTLFPSHWVVRIIQPIEEFDKAIIPFTLFDHNTRVSVQNLKCPYRQNFYFLIWFCISPNELLRKKNLIWIKCNLF